MACAGQSQRPAPRVNPGAIAGAQRLADSLRSDDPSGAYAMLAPEVQAQISYDDFAATWRATAHERRARASAIEDAIAGAPRIEERARVATDGGGSLYLVREGQAWRLESALISTFYAPRPEDAVRIFASALVARDYSALLQSLTQQRRREIDSRFGGFVRSLHDSLQSHLRTIEVVNAERAELRWDDGDMRYRITLRKEGDEWRIDDVYLRPKPQSDAEAGE